MERLTETITILRTKMWQMPNNKDDYLKAVQKLGQLEDILEKYGIDDIEELDKILEIHKFLLEHNYQTLPKEDLDVLFDELEKYKVAKGELL